MQRRDTWRNRLIDRMVEIALNNPKSRLEDVVEVVCLSSGFAAEMYYKELSEQGVRHLLKEVRELIRESKRPCEVEYLPKGGEEREKVSDSLCHQVQAGDTGNDQPAG